MITEDNKEAIRARLQAALEDLETKLADAEKSYMKDSIKEAIDKNVATLQELDANAAYGSATLRHLATAGEANRALVASHQAIVDVLTRMDEHQTRSEDLAERSIAALERQAAAFERIAELLAKQ